MRLRFGSTFDERNIEGHSDGRYHKGSTHPTTLLPRGSPQQASFKKGQSWSA